MRRGEDKRRCMGAAAAPGRGGTAADVSKQKQIEREEGGREHYKLVPNACEHAGRKPRGRG